MKIACIDVDHVFYLSLTGEKILDENGEPVKVDGKFTYRERTFEESCKVADDYITNILIFHNTYLDHMILLMNLQPIVLHVC